MLLVYKKVNLHELKCIKQMIHKFVTIGGPFILLWVYYQFNPPATGIDRVVSKLIYVLTFESIISVILSIIYFQIQDRK